MTLRTDSVRPGFWSSIREAVTGTQQDFTTGPLGRGIALLAIPMVIEMLGESCFAVVDVYFVSRLGEDAIATVGLTEAMLTIIYAVAIGLTLATTALVARRIGEKDPEAAARAAVQAILLGALVSTAIAVVGTFYAPDLLRLMGATEEIVRVGSPFTRVMFATNIVIVLLFLNNAVFRGAGDATLAMVSLWAANLINMVLDPLLIFGVGPFPEMGLRGAAVATSIGRGTAVCLQLWLLFRGSDRIRLAPEYWVFRPALMLRIVRVSLGGILQFLVETASFVALVRIVATFGSTAVAGYTIGIRIVIFTFLPAWGLSNAAATLVGQNLGARRPDRAERSVWLTGLYNMIFLGAVSVVFITAARPVVEIFTRDPEVTAVAVDCLRTISYGYVFFAWGMVMVQCFNGAGDTMTPTWVNLFCFWVCQIPIAWYLATTMKMGAAGVFWAIAVSYSISALVGLVLFRRGKWKERLV